MLSGSFVGYLYVILDGLYREGETLISFSVGGVMYKVDVVIVKGLDSVA